MSEVKENQKPVQLGFIGVGWIGRNRMEAILNQTSSVAKAIAEPEEDSRNAALATAKDAVQVASPENLYKDEELDGLVIATPSAMHAEQSIQALQSGKAVFCQKPLGRTAEEVRQVVEASRKADKLLSVDLSYRYTHAYKAIYDLIKRGDIGDVYAVDLVFHNAYGPDKKWFYDITKSGGGCVMDLGIHLVDLALWTLEFPEIQSLQSHLYHKGQRLSSFEDEVEDFASVTMLSAQDQIINLQCSWNLPAGQDAVIEARFYGTKGGAAFKNINGSFYDFQAEKYHGTARDILVTPPDDWGGRAGVIWAKELAVQNHFDNETAEEYIKTAQIIDRIYGR